MIKKIQVVHKLATHVLTMALLMSLPSCGDPGDDKNNKKQDKLKFTIDCGLGVSKETQSEATIAVKITVKQGELDPTKWTIHVDDFSATANCKSPSSPVLSCAQNGQTIKQVNNAFPDKLTKADGAKSFNVVIASQNPFGDGTKSVDIKVGFATVTLKGKHTTKDGKEKDEEVREKVTFIVAP